MKANTHLHLLTTLSLLSHVTILSYGAEEIKRAGSDEDISSHANKHIRVDERLGDQTLTTIPKWRYISLKEDGVVTIKQDIYPKYLGAQNLRLEPKIISELKINENGMPYHLVDYNDIQGPFEGTRIEITLNDQEQPFSIIEPKNVQDKPYSSVGRLTLLYPNFKAYGIAAALDKNLVITAAHNFLPKDIDGRPNADRERTKSISFHNFLINAMTSNQPLRPAKVSTHCFIHPEWENNFDTKYDVALVFLSDDLIITADEFVKAINHGIFNLVGKDKLEVRGHLDGIHEIKSGTWQQSVVSKEIIYHFANTLPGSSGSPIISEDNYLVGVHTRGHIDEKGNSGVRMRHELLPFLEESIQKHQEFLTNIDKFEELKAEERERQEKALIDKGIEKGKLEIARNLISMKVLTIEQIVTASQLPIETIKSLKNDMELD